MLCFPVNGQDVCHVQGECQEGYQLQSLGASSYFDCQSKCQDTDDCNYFTFYDSNDFCKLLYNCTSVDASLCPQCFTGEKDCETSICSQPGECQGSFVADLFVLDEENCQKECFENNECLWYSFDVDFDYCLLTKDCSPINSTSKVFGQKSCYDDINNGPMKPSKCQLT